MDKITYIRLDNEQRAIIERVAYYESKSVSEIIRQMINQQLKAKKYDIHRTVKNNDYIISDRRQQS